MKVKIYFDNENERYKIYNGDTVINADDVTIYEVPIDSELSDTSANAVENRAVKTALDNNKAYAQEKIETLNSKVDSNKSETDSAINTINSRVDEVIGQGLRLIKGTDFSWTWTTNVGNSNNFQLPANTVVFISIPKGCSFNVNLNDVNIYELGDTTATDTQIGMFVTGPDVTSTDNFSLWTLMGTDPDVKDLIEANTTLFINDSPQELKDIRVDAYGNIWSSAGDSVRSIQDNLKNYFNLDTEYNLLNPDNSIRGNMGTTGVVTENDTSAYLVSDYIEVKQGQTYALTYKNATFLTRFSMTPNRMCFFDTSKTFKEQSTSSSTTGTYFNSEIVIVAGVSNTRYYKFTPLADGYIRFQYGANFDEPQMAEGDVYEYMNYYAPRYLLKDKIIEENNLSQELQDKIDNGADPIYKFNYCKMHAKVLFVGDSLTEGARTSGDIRKDKSYPAYASKLMDCEYLNKGVSGITTLGWWQAYGSTVDFTEYDAMFVYLGTNGGLTDTVEEDTASGDYNTYAETNTGAYCSIVAKALDVNPNIKIYLVKYGTTTVSNITQEIADKYGVPTILVTDTRYFTLTDSFYHTDATHYNTVGYWALANVLMIQVEEYIKNHISDYTDL